MLYFDKILLFLKPAEGKNGGNERKDNQTSKYDWVCLWLSKMQLPSWDRGKIHGMLTAGVYTLHRIGTPTRFEVSIFFRSVVTFHTRRLEAPVFC